MSARIFSGLLLAGCGVLGYFLMESHKTTERIQRESVANMSVLSNQLHAATALLQEQKYVNVSLETNLSQRLRDIGSLSNRWSQLRTDFSRLQSEAESATLESKRTRETLERREQELAALEREREQIGKRLEDMSQAIDALAADIRETERRLATSEGDREFLQNELRRMMTEKVELEQKLTDIVFLRDQVRKLRDEMAGSRKMDFLRRSFYAIEEKSVGRLRERLFEGGGAVPSPDSALNVELGPDGARVVAPTDSNAPVSPVQP
jgi:chromosome segregation ATPase